MRYYAPFPGGGELARPRGPHALRIGDAEREAAATDLGEHYAAGRLTLDELHERLDAVFSAKTLGHLARIMADLPGESRVAWHGAWHGAGPHGAWPHGGWDPAVFPYAHLGMAGSPWPGAGLPDSGAAAREQHSTPADRAGRFAALSLLLIAMLIWLFTALLFARTGYYYHQGGPGVQQGSTLQYIQHMQQNGSFRNGPGTP